MTYGIDTDFLVAYEIVDHPFHATADRLLRELLGGEHNFALAPQTLAEFIHIVTDPRRMPVPLDVTDAISRAENWWQAAEVVRVYPVGMPYPISSPGSGNINSGGSAFSTPSSPRRFARRR